MIKKIQKRTGEIVPFDQEKIVNAIFKAGQATGEYGKKEARVMAEKVVVVLNKVYGQRSKPPHVEEIQDVVEIEIMKAGFSRSAKAYILYRKERERIREAKKEILSGKSTKLPFSLNSLKLLASRYLLKDPLTKKVLETPEEMFLRVAKSLAAVEKQYGASPSQVRAWEGRFYEIMAHLEFLPAGRTLVNAGTDNALIANCLVLHIQDSLESIFQTLKEAALLQQVGCGLGYPWHLLRPAGFLTKRTKGIASGPVSFLEAYDKAFGVIQYSGSQGANMAVMRIDHPDVLEFIHAKDKEGSLRHFNISVALTDEFMRRVKQRSQKTWWCHFGSQKMLARRIVRDQDGIAREIKEVKMTAEQIMHEIVGAAWSNGEPGVIFIDQVNRTNPLPGLGPIQACNVCGEQFLHDGDVCNLGSVNLDRFVLGKKINWARLKEVVFLAVRMLDNVVDLAHFPVERVNSVFKKNRRIGLGIMGFSEMLFQLDIPYNSEKGRQFAKRVMGFINEQAHLASQELALEKGVFGNYSLSVYAKKGIKMRNAALTTIAPTGKISMIVDTSSGLEPCFALSFVKKEMSGLKDFYYTNRYLKERLQKEGIFNEELAQKIAEKGSIQDIKEIPESIKKVFVTALDIAAPDHTRMQAVFQSQVDNSISKTINLPNRSSQMEVLEAYLLAWELKCKTCTVYRQGSRRAEALSPGLNNNPSDNLSFSNPGPQAKTCPYCKLSLINQEGCFSCPGCGFGICSV